MAELLHGQVLGLFHIAIEVDPKVRRGATPTDLLKAADRALYRGKQERRDRVCVAGE